MWNTLFYAFSIPIYSFSICIIILGIIGLTIVQSQFEIFNLKPLLRPPSIFNPNMHTCGLLSIIGAIIGAYLFDYIIKQITPISFQHTAIGIVYWGGILGFLISFILISILKKTPFIYPLDIIALSTPIMHSLGRLGCLYAGCCYGSELLHTRSLGLKFPLASLSTYASSPPLAPVQIIEALCSLVIAFLLIKKNIKKSSFGLTLYLYLLLYSTLRIAIETLRGDLDRGFFYSAFSSSQFISAFIIVLLLLLNFINFKKNKSMEVAGIEPASA